MKTKVFVYRNFLGISSSIDSEGVLNDPTCPTSIGFVMDATKVLFSKEAINALSNLTRGTDSLGDVDCFQTITDTPVVFSWLGGPKTCIDLSDKEIVTARGANFSLVTATQDVEIDEDFKKYIDSLYN